MTNGKPDEDHFILMIREKKNCLTSISSEVKILNNNIIEFQEKSEFTPVLFKMFPLIGTESFNYPFILNNLDWETNPER